MNIDLENFRAWKEAWLYNTKNRFGEWFSKNIFRFKPRCECGWLLVQRFDGLWVCGTCMFSDDHLPEDLKAMSQKRREDCRCYACSKRKRA